MTGQVASRHRWALATLGIVIAAGLGLLMVAPVRAQTFQEALAAAYNTNPVILSGRARLRQTDEGVPQALSNWRPRVTTSPSADRPARNALRPRDLPTRRAPQRCRSHQRKANPG